MLIGRELSIVRRAAGISRGFGSLRGVALLLVTFSTLIFAGRATCGASVATESPADRHVLVISVDGLGARWYMAPPPNLRAPNLERLKHEGSYAEGVVGVYPSVTYPSHTTLVTGRMPRDHGIYSNLSSRQAGKNPHEWFWFASSIKVPTLWDEARQQGLKSAAVSWPASVGAAIDWNVPEIWDPAKGDVMDFEYIAKHSTPGLVEEALAVMGAPKTGEEEDTVRTRMAVYLLKKYKPNLLLVHVAALDGAEHDHGPQSPEAVASLEKLDARIGDLLAAVKDAGLKDSTDVFIVSDHGFLPIEREIRPNVLLGKAGLLDINDKGEITGGRVATVASGGAFFIYWSDERVSRAEVDAALKPLRDEGVLWGVLERSALADLGAEAAVELALEAPEGASFSSGAAGELVTKREKPGGTHGYLPFRKGLESSFIAGGPHIRQGVNLHRIRMTSIGPTILKALGIADPKFGEQPPLLEIFK